MVGITEAASAIGWPIDGLDVLSIGTTAEPFDVSRERRQGGIAQWNRGLVDLLMTAQVRGALGLADALTKRQVRRIDVTTRPGRFSLDNSREISELKALGENSARQAADEINQRFLSSPAEIFEPYHRSNAIEKGGNELLKTA